MTGHHFSQYPVIFLLVFTDQAVLFQWEVLLHNSIHLKSKVFIKIYIFFIVCFQRYHHVVFLRICDRFV